MRSLVLVLLLILSSSCTTSHIVAQCQCIAACEELQVEKVEASVDHTSTPTIPGLSKAWDWLSAVVGWLVGGL